MLSAVLLSVNDIPVGQRPHIIRVFQMFICFSSRPPKVQLRRGRDRMVVGFTNTYAVSAYHHWAPSQSVSITSNVVSSNLAHGKEYSIQHYIKFISILRWQVVFSGYSDFLITTI